ncbi:hypothetical protein PUMCH_000688 [Australozyma saopauloensis]|uniref:RING-Gid-type domain-containing protein n=1 Tax=Australozyma saopauloensis TaxID=291208 RepID=A0AAX4H4G1_9ASCO|nr:hypothetical protein PUMCH_000688 [[Candida] saopauloensis]
MSEPTLNFFIQTRQVQFAVPNELLKKNLKAVQKLIEKVRKLLLDEIVKTQKSPHLTPQEKLTVVRKLIRSFEQFQKKLRVLVDKDAEYRRRLAARVNRLAQLQLFVVKSNKDIDDPPLDFHNEDFMTWLRDEANLLIIDYLLKSNVVGSTNVGSMVASKLSQKLELPLQDLIDIDVYETYNKVFLSITQNHDLDLITTWYTDNRNALKKIGLNLQFEIHYCRYLHLISTGQMYEAILYSKENLAPYAQSQFYSPEEQVNFASNTERLSEVGSPFTCDGYLKAICTPKTPISAILYGQNQPSNGLSVVPTLDSRIQAEKWWARLAECFTQDYTQIYGISHTYPLLVYLSAGLSCLKTKSCFCYGSNTIFGTNRQKKHMAKYSNDDPRLRGPNVYYDCLGKINQCPVCSPELFALSSSLPYGLFITSIFNKPILLPNGNIYPYDKLNAHSKKYGSDSKILDPLTNELFGRLDCLRVFPA